MVEEAFQYRATPEDATTGETAWTHIQTCREVYNHALTQEYHPEPDHDKPSYTAMQNQLPDWKRKWSEWKQVDSKCLQMAVRRIKHSESVLGSLQERGFNVGRLNWKAPREDRSIIYDHNADTQRYDVVFLEDLSVGNMMRQNGNSRNIAAMSWYETLQTFQRFGEKNGCHVVLVRPEGTAKRCVQCGGEPENPIWVREHLCPLCGLETDRDKNAALEIQRLGLLELGVVENESGLGQKLAESTPAETDTATGSRSSSFRDVIPARAVVDTGSPTLNEATSAAE